MPPSRSTVRPPPLVAPTADFHGFVLAAAACFVLAMLLGSLYSIRLLPVFLALGSLLCVAVPVIRWPVVTSAAWLLLAGSSPEMWLGDMMPGQANTITAVVKLLGLALLAVCMLRYGVRLDWFNPAFAFLAMFVAGLAHGLWPTLTVMESLRSLIGAVAPFAFSFSRLSRRWCNAIITATIWVPTAIIGFGVLLALAHLRPLFTEMEGWRLQGSTHPAFLGGFAAAAIYAALVELYRDGRSSRLWMIIVNYAILVLSGARAPLAAALGVTAVVFFFLRSDPFPARRRLPMVLLGMLVLPVLVAIATGSSAIRLLNVLSTDANDLSGRGLIWPLFRQAWAASPLFGWGIGAGKSVVDPQSLLAKLLGTTAAHNEYLRIGVDGGDVGLGLLILMMAGWVIWWTRAAPRTDRFIMRCVLIAFAVHSYTDNTLIAATASVMFAWVSAVFARAALERTEAASAREAAIREMSGGAAPRRQHAAQIA